jgi:hypothetical protein
MNGRCSPEKRDKIIIGILMGLSILPLGFLRVTIEGIKSLNILIMVDSETVKQIKLDDSKSSKIYDFKYGITFKNSFQLLY